MRTCGSVLGGVRTSFSSWIRRRHRSLIAGIETPEGLDKLMSLLYYSRIRFIHQLMPLLEATPLASANVISVYAAGMETPNKNLYLNDLSLRDPNSFGFAATRNHVVHMKTLAFEKLAQQHPKLSLVHIFPGLVITPGFDRNPMPLWFKIIWPVLVPVARLFALAPDDIAEWVLGFTSEKFSGIERAKSGEVEAAVSTDGSLGGGAYSVRYDGYIYGPIAAYQGLRCALVRDWNSHLLPSTEIKRTRIIPEHARNRQT